MKQVIYYLCICYREFFSLISNISTDVILSVVITSMYTKYKIFEDKRNNTSYLLLKIKNFRNLIRQDIL